MGTRPTDLVLHLVSPVPRIASAASMGQHASKVAQEQDTSVDRTQKAAGAHKSNVVAVPSAAANWAERSWALGSFS